MDRHEELRDKAIKNLKIADHMLTQTYPHVNDPKLLLTVLENIFLALTNSMGALLHFERQNKSIPPFHENFESKYNLLKMELASRHNISNEHIKFIGDIKNMVIAHKKSPVEFSRKGSYVMCSEDYNMKTLDSSGMRDYISKARSFLSEVEGIIGMKSNN